MVDLGLIAAASATDAAIQKKVYGSGTTLVFFWNENLNHIMKIVNSLEDVDLLINVFGKIFGYAVYYIWC